MATRIEIKYTTAENKVRGDVNDVHVCVCLSADGVGGRGWGGERGRGLQLCTSIDEHPLQRAQDITCLLQLVNHASIHLIIINTHCYNE